MIFWRSKNYNPRSLPPLASLLLILAISGVDHVLSVLQTLVGKTEEAKRNMLKLSMAFLSFFKMQLFVEIHHHIIPARGRGTLIFPTHE